MDNIQNIGGMIRLPFELLGKALNFILDNILALIILSCSIYFIYWFFSKGIYKRFGVFFEKEKKLNMEEENEEHKDI